MDKEIFLSVVIPCYNEEKNIRLGALGKVSDYLQKQPYSWEVIIVDDGSEDESRSLIEEFRKSHLGFSLIKNKHQGKAATVITGMVGANGQYVLFCDLDQATPINELEKLLPLIQKDYDVVIGSRNTEREGAPLSRIIMARGFMFLRTLILGLSGITDTQCGFKIFKNEVAKKIFNRLKLYGQKKLVSGSMVTAGFDIEILFVAKKLGFKIKEVPVEWHYVETRRVSPLKDSWQAFCDLLKIRLKSLQGLYE
ncbi:MAG: glycosyltransferase [Patescibacteria group bacterium]|nr:glycosyltransferase [Patescibacteria group bacterium]MCL5095200.1 glycosyltransferase [Patescibacteria group bacterium]